MVLDMTYASLIEDAGPLASRSKVRLEVDKILDTPMNGQVDRDSWGTAPEQIEGQRAAEEMFGR